MPVGIPPKGATPGAGGIIGWGGIAVMGCVKTGWGGIGGAIIGGTVPIGNWLISPPDKLGNNGCDGMT